MINPKPVGWASDSVTRQSEDGTAGLRQANSTHITSAIQPIIIGDSQRAVDISNALLKAGFLVSAIRPPTVPQGSARLRVTFSALHEEQHVDRLLDALDKATARLRVKG
jgi:8-amino-7-oxononanoate synthase